MQNQYRAMASKDIAGRREEDHQCARVFQTAMDWLEMNASHDGFYLWLDSFDPHEPWDVPDKYIDMYAPGYQGKKWFYPNLLSYADMTAPEIEHAKALYAAEVTMVDHWLGRFLQKLDELGLRENTLLILLSDHGKIVGEFENFGMSCKDTSRYLYDVPLMVRHPDGTGAGKRLDQWVYDIDVTATALDVLGEEPLPRADGQSFWPLITGAADKLHDYAVCGYSAVSCVWQDDYVYIQDNDLRTAGLYDAWADKDQQHDLSQQLPELAADMKAKLDELVNAGPH
jgi:arylsulfatase A-like enzyme